MDFDLGNEQTANVISGAAQGFSKAAENLYNIQMAKVKLNQSVKESDADIELKHAQTNKMEAEGTISTLQADQMRDFINKQQKASDAKSDLTDATISTVQDRVHKAALSYHGLLTQALQTPEGQQYVQDKNNPGAQGAAPQQPANGSQVVNSIMPSVGANNAPDAMPANPAPQTPAGDIRPIQVNGNQQPAAPASPASPAQALPDLPPLGEVYKGLSTRPFGESQDDLYMKNPNVMEAIKSGNYLVKKDTGMLQVQNPLSLNEMDRTVLADVEDLKKAGYKQDDIFGQLSPGLQSMIKSVGQYRYTPAELTSTMGGGRAKQELIKATNQFYPKVSEAIYDQRHKSLIDFTDPNGKNGQAIVSTRQGIEHMDELTKSIDAVSNKTMPVGLGRSVPVLNAGMNRIMQDVGGDPDILALKQNINAVSEEMTKAWGGSQAGEGRLKNWRDTMNSANSPQGWSGLLSKSAKLWEDAAKARESMFGLAMGGQKMQDILGEGVLQPEHQAILDRIKNGYTPGQSNNNPNAAFIEKAKAAGYNDDQINQYLSGKK